MQAFFTFSIVKMVISDETVTIVCHLSLFYAILLQFE